MFKFLPLFLVSITSFAAVQSPKIVKSADGKIAYCSSARNVGAYAYMPSNFSVTSDDNFVSVDLNMAALKCASGAQWVSRAFNAPQTKFSSDGTPVLVKFRNQEFRLISVIESKYNIVGAVKVASETNKNLSYSLVPEQFLSQAEQDRLANGGTVHARLELFMWGLSSYTMNGRTVNMGQFSGGSFIVTFDLTKSESGLSVRNVKFY